MVTVPADSPATTPVELLMVAIEVALLLQLPPVALDVNVVAVPAHKVEAPLMVPAEPAEVMVTFVVADAEPQLLLTV